MHPRAINSRSHYSIAYIILYFFYIFQQISCDPLIFKGRTLAGDGSLNFRDGAPSSSQINTGAGQIAIHATTLEVYFCDMNNYRIRKIGNDGLVSTVIGREPDGAAEYDGIGTNAQIIQPYGLSVDSSRNILYASDTFSYHIRYIDLTTYNTSSLPLPSYPRDNEPPDTIILTAPRSLALDEDHNVLYVSDDTGIKSIDMNSCSPSWMGSSAPPCPITYINNSTDVASLTWSRNTPYRLLAISSPPVSILYMIATPMETGAYTSFTPPPPRESIGQLYSVAVDRNGNIFLGGSSQLYLLSNGALFPTFNTSSSSSSPLSNFTYITYSSPFLASNTVLRATISSMAFSPHGQLVISTGSTLSVLYAGMPSLTLSNYPSMVGAIQSTSAVVSWADLPYLDLLALDSIKVMWAWSNFYRNASVTNGARSLLITYPAISNQTVNVTVIFSNSFGSTPYSFQFVTTFASIPNAPSLVWPAITTSVDFLVVGWQRPNILVDDVGLVADTSIHNYTITVNTIDRVVQVATVDSSSLSVALLKLVPMTAYSISVRAANGLGFSPESDLVVFTTTGLLNSIAPDILPPSTSPMDGDAEGLNIISDNSGSIYVSRPKRHVIMHVDPTGVTTDFVGRTGTLEAVDGNGTDASLGAVSGLTYLSNSTLSILYFVDLYCIRQVDVFTRSVTLLTGACGESGVMDGTQREARFSSPVMSIAIDDLEEIIYVTDDIYIRSVTLDTGFVTTLNPDSLPSPGDTYCVRRDGPLDSARFCGLGSLIIMSSGLFIDDSNVLRYVDLVELKVMSFGEIDLDDYTDGFIELGAASLQTVTGRGAFISGLAVRQPLTRHDFTPSLIVADSTHGMVRVIAPSLTSYSFLGSLAGTNVSITKRNVSGMTVATTYDFHALDMSSPRALAVDNNGFVYAVDTGVVVIYGSTPSPPVLYHINSTARRTSLELSWRPTSPMAATRSFSLLMDDGQGGSMQNVANTVDFKSNQTDLITGLQYAFQIFASNEFGTGPLSPPYVVNTLPPGPPANPSILVIGRDYFNVTWSAPQDYRRFFSIPSWLSYNIYIGTTRATPTGTSNTNATVLPPGFVPPLSNQEPSPTAPPSAYAGNLGGIRDPSADGSDNIGNGSDISLDLPSISRLSWLSVNVTKTRVSIGGLTPLSLYIVYIAASTPVGRGDLSDPQFFATLGSLSTAISHADLSGASGALVAQSLNDFEFSQIAIYGNDLVFAVVDSNILYMVDKSTMCLSTFMISAPPPPPLPPTEVDDPDNRFRRDTHDDHDDTDIIQKSFDSPAGLVVRSSTGEAFYADRALHCIKVIDLDDPTVYHVFSGICGVLGYQDGLISEGNVLHNLPSGLAFDQHAENLYVMDDGSSTLRRIDLADKIVSTVSLRGASFFISPSNQFSLAFDVMRNHLYLGEINQNFLMRIDLRRGSSGAIYGNVTRVVSGVTETNVAVRMRMGIAVNSKTGLVYVTDSSPTLNLVDPVTGMSGTLPMLPSFAGVGTVVYDDDGGYIFSLQSELSVIYGTAPLRPITIFSTSGNGTHLDVSWRTGDPIAVIDYFQVFIRPSTSLNTTRMLVYQGRAQSVLVGPLNGTIPFWNVQVVATNIYGSKSNSVVLKAMLPEIYYVSSTPTSGGLFTILGKNFFGPLDELALVIEGIGNVTDCDIQMPSTSMWSSSDSNGTLICSIGPGTGANKPVLLSVGPATALELASYSYLPPIVKAISPPLIRGGPLTLKGENFGATASLVSVFARTAAGSLLNCTDVVILDAHTQVQCTLPPLHPYSVIYNNHINIVVDRQDNFVDRNSLFALSAFAEESPPSSLTGDDRLNPAILGSVIGGGFFVIIIIVLSYFIVMRRRVVKTTLRSIEMMSRSLPTSNRDIYLSNVTRGQSIGHGSFGNVYQGDWQGVTVALKTVVCKDNLSELAKEAAILQSLIHPHIVQFIGLYEDEDEILYIVTEFMPEGSLDKLLYKNSPATISNSMLLQMARDVAAAMLQLEHKGLVHCDLACRNLLVTTQKDRYIVKISDFGLSRMVRITPPEGEGASVNFDRIAQNGSQPSSGSSGSSGRSSKDSQPLLPLKWSAPEAIFDNIFTSKTDVWSFGITFWEILNFGRTPYSGMSNKQAVKHVMDGNRLPLPTNISAEVSAMLMKCWSLDPDARPTFSEILDVLNNELGSPTASWSRTPSEIGSGSGSVFSSLGSQSSPILSPRNDRALPMIHEEYNDDDHDDDDDEDEREKLREKEDAEYEVEAHYARAGGGGGGGVSDNINSPKRDAGGVDVDDEDEDEDDDEPGESSCDSNPAPYDTRSDLGRR